MRSISVTAGVVLAVALGVTAAAYEAVAGTAAAATGTGRAVAGMAPAPAGTARAVARTDPGVTLAAQPSASPEHPLLAVSCVSSKYCVAVGYDEAAHGGYGGPLAETWNGRGWATTALKLPAGALGASLSGVSCKSQKSCFAVGDYLLPTDTFPESDNAGALAEWWNGKTWTVATPAAPAGATSAALGGVSCVTSADCVATGVYTRADGTSAGLAEQWNGHAWANVPVKLPAGSAGGDLFAVSCASSKSCVAVGSYGNADFDIVALGESWNGKTWTASEPSAPAGALAAALQSVSCVSPTACVAVGWYTQANGYPVGLAESWNGRKWTDVRLPKSGGYGQLFAVSCVSPRYCLATGVGDGSVPVNSKGTPSSAVWNGKSWSFKKVPVPPKGGGSTATSMLQGARCLSATDCVAVGQLILGSDEQYQYGFSAFWNGKTWKLVATTSLPLAHEQAANRRSRVIRVGMPHGEHRGLRPALQPELHQQ
jgi:hypothetical protein